MALRAIATRVKMAAPKERVPKEGPTAWLTDRRVVPLVPEGASGGAKYLQTRHWQLKSQVLTSHLPDEHISFQIA